MAPPTFSKLKKLKLPQNDALKMVQTSEAVDDDAVMTSTEVGKRPLSLSDLPWDTVNIIFDFTPKQEYKMFRLNKAFTRLINKRKKGLTFKDQSILPETFGEILKNNELRLQELRVLVPIKRLKMTLFESFQFRPRNLQVLDVKKIEVISEQAIQRMLTSCKNTLETVKLTYRGTQGFTKGAALALANCSRLRNVEFAAQNEYIAQVPPVNL